MLIIILLCAVLGVTIGLVTGLLINKLNKGMKPEQASMTYAHYATTRGE